jgi:hypothetical protein
MKFMNRVRLQAIADVTEQIISPAGRSVPTLHWSVDEETGRPVCCWVLLEACPASEA